VLRAELKESVACHDQETAAGWLGFRTYALAPNHVHLLGSPANHDNGERLLQMTSGDSYYCFDGTALYGFDMGPGVTFRVPDSWAGARAILRAQ